MFIFALNKSQTAPRPEGVCRQLDNGLAEAGKICRRVEVLIVIVAWMECNGIQDPNYATLHPGYSLSLFVLVIRDRGLVTNTIHEHD